ncbi:MAG: terminase small subunit [Deltaproteobacteria bacterium]|nr:terminase small subunit [Deltaproteobacteria bacterium]
MSRSNGLTQKQATFCLKYFELGNASEAARIALYSPRTAAVIGRENLLKPKIKAKIAELRQKAEDATIADVIERRQVLTEIVRGRFADFMTKLTPEKLRSAALQEIRITEVGQGTPIKTTTIKLHSAIQAIDTLNKMDKLYTDGAMVSIDNRKIEIIVESEEAKELTKRLLEGERT